MIYKAHNLLTCYTMPNECDAVGFNELKKILMMRPTNVIYCEKAGKLHGIISMGDIVRACNNGKDQVIVNKCFTSVGMNGYMCARQIFKDNNRINALPIINDLNELIGDYSRWDDLIVADYFKHLKSSIYEKGLREVIKRFALVKPCKEFDKRQEIMEIWKEFFLRAGIPLIIIEKEKIAEVFDLVDDILFVDEDEKRGIGTLYKNILGENFDWCKAKTCAEMGHEILREIKDKVEDEIGKEIESEVIRSALSAGVNIITLNRIDDGNEYYRILQKDIEDKFFQIGKRKTCTLHAEFGRDFFAELYSKEYEDRILNHQYVISYIDDICKLKESDQETYKVTDGERLTVAQPLDYQRCIYFYGPCVMIGQFVADEHTIESFLQAKLNAEGLKVKCINYGCWGNSLLTLNRIASTVFHRGDIIVLFSENRKYEGIPSINLVDVCDRYNVPVTWMVETILHCNHKLNSIYANEIFEKIEPVLREPIGEKISVKIPKNFITSAYGKRYFYNLAEYTKGVVGSIVMNCNPFTLGHRYLIEQAQEQVDHLIIFVVEEDRSMFSFNERFAMVAEGTKDLENVIVVPSGSTILSQRTFPEYFLKIEDENVVRNAEYDITLFAEQIAPMLHITYRFVGEEPEDVVTNAYNTAMRRILPAYGINLVEIPRMKTKEKLISASTVRKKLMEGDGEDLDRFIPQTTKEVLGYG